MASNQNDTTVQVNKEELRRTGDLVISPHLISLIFNLLTFAFSLFRFFLFLFSCVHPLRAYYASSWRIY